MPWFSVTPLMFIFPSGVRMTPGTRGKAARNFCSTSGKARISPPLMVAGGAVVGCESDRGRFFLYLNVLPKNFLARQDKLEEWAILLP